MDDDLGIQVTDWDVVGQTLELKKGRQAGVSPEFARLFEMAAGASIILVEVMEGGTVAAFSYFLDNAAAAGSYAVPILGVTTPYDIESHRASIGAKSAAWVTSAPAEDDWITEKFNIIRPGNLFEVAPFIKTVAAKAKERVVFVSDMLDEIYDLVEEKEFHAFLSRLHTLMKGSGCALILVVQPALYTKGYLAMIERYADARISFGEHIDYVDYKTNAKERVK